MPRSKSPVPTSNTSTTEPTTEPTATSSSNLGNLGVLAQKPPNHSPYELDPQHRGFLARSLARCDSELAALHQLHEKLRKVRDLIVGGYGEGLLLDLGEGIVKLSPLDDFTLVVDDHGNGSGDERGGRGELASMTRVKPEMIESSGERTNARNGGYPTREDPNENKHMAALCRDFLLHMKLRTKILNRLARRLNRVSHAMDGQVTAVLPPPLPKYGDEKFPRLSLPKSKVITNSDSKLSQDAAVKGGAGRDADADADGEDDSPDDETKVVTFFEKWKKREEMKIRVRDRRKKLEETQKSTEQSGTDTSVPKGMPHADDMDTLSNDNADIVTSSRDDMDITQSGYLDNDASPMAVTSSSNPTQTQMDSSSTTPPTTIISEDQIDALVQSYDPLLLDEEHQSNLRSLAQYDDDYEKILTITTTTTNTNSSKPNNGTKAQNNSTHTNTNQTKSNETNNNANTSKISISQKLISSLKPEDLAKLEKTEDDFSFDSDQQPHHHQRIGIGATIRNMSSKEKATEWKRWQTDILGRIPDQPTFQELGMVHRVFALEERRKKLEKKDGEASGTALSKKRAHDGGDDDSSASSFTATSDGGGRKGKGKIDSKKDKDDGHKRISSSANDGDDMDVDTVDEKEQTNQTKVAKKELRVNKEVQKEESDDDSDDDDDNDDESLSSSSSTDSEDMDSQDEDEEDESDAKSKASQKGKKGSKGQEKKNATQKEDEKDKDDDVQEPPPIKKRKPISLQPIPSFHDQDYRRTLMIHNDMQNTSIHDHARSRIADATNEYNVSFRRSSEINDKKQALEQQLSKMMYQHRMQVNKIRNDLALEVAIAKAKWHREKEQFEAEKKRRRQMELQMYGRNVHPSVMAAMKMDNRTIIKRSLQSAVDRVVIRNERSERSVGTPTTSSTARGRNPIYSAVASTLSHVVDVVVRRVENRWVSNSVMDAAQGEQFPEFKPPKSLGENTIVNDSGDTLKEVQHRAEKKIKREIHTLSSQLISAEKDRLALWSKLMKTKAEFEVPSAKGAGRKSQVDMTNLPAPPLKGTVGNSRTYAQPMHPRGPSSQTIGNNMRRSHPSSPSPNSSTAGSHQSKYSADKVKARIYSDGSVMPVSIPKRTKDGLFMRPAGRQRKGMDWDPVVGKWVPAAQK